MYGGVNFRLPKRVRLPQWKNVENVQFDLHIWDGHTYSESNYPVAHCGIYLYPKNFGNGINRLYIEREKVCEHCTKVETTDIVFTPDFSIEV